MGRSLKIASIRGIDVRLHITFPLILLVAALDWGTEAEMGVRGGLYGIALVLLLFVCVVLHELGHSLMAMRFGVKVKDITLLPIGGVAQMRRMPEKARQELLVALAGPAVNVAIAAVLSALVWQLNGEQWPSIFRMVRSAAFPSPRGLLTYMLLANAGMALFNMIPAFPMDGGRVARALLSMILGHMRATTVAARAGQLISVGFLLLSVKLLSPLMMLVAFFIFTSAASELRGARVRNVLGSITAGQAVGPSVPPPLEPDQPLGSVTQLAIWHREPDFPVMRDGQLVGLLRSSELNEAMREHGPWAPVRAAMMPPSISARDSDSLYDVEQLLVEHDADSVTVNGDNGFLGVLTRQRIGQLYGAAMRAAGARS